MIKNILNNFKNLDNLTKQIIKNGLKFCSILGTIALIILITYNLSFTIPILFTISFILFKLSIIWGVEFIICGIIVDKIKTEAI